MEKTGEERIKEFVERYGKLVEELDVDFANYPVYMPTGDGTFQTVIQNTPVDMKTVAKKSPFMQAS